MTSLVLVILMLTLTGCTPMVVRAGPNQPVSTAIKNPHTTPLGIKAGRLAVKRNNRESGFLVLSDGEEALLWRGLLADRATRTIDAQYFIWSQDNVGTIAAERLIQAADRGVRVRVIVDEITLDAKPLFLIYLDGHRNVEIRVYNPSGSIGMGGVGKMMNLLGDFRRLNRRMHNKAFIVDGSFAILGGRNVADEYFDLDPRLNFRDLDLLAVGPVIPEISNSFDEYWNSEWVIPVGDILQIKYLPEDAEKYFTQLHEYAGRTENFPPRFQQDLESLSQHFDAMGPATLDWGVARLIYDAPGKNLDLNSLEAFGESGRQLTELALSARHEIIVETPYLVLLEGTFHVLDELINRGVKISFITNSLAATDAIWVHASYASQRNKLLDMGIDIFEYRSSPDDKEHFIKHLIMKNKDMIVSLHAKTMVIDDRFVFVGSFNMDPRSTHLNTEMGLVVDSIELAGKITSRLKNDMAPQNSWRVTLQEDGRTKWATRKSGQTDIRESEPDVTIGKALLFLPLAILPITPLM